MANRTPEDIGAHAKLIDDLGGPSVVRALIVERSGRAMTRENASAMKRLGIPAKWRGIIADAAREKGCDVPDRFESEPWA